MTCTIAEHSVLPEWQNVFKKWSDLRFHQTDLNTALTYNLMNYKDKGSLKTSYNQCYYLKLQLHLRHTSFIIKNMYNDKQCLVITMKKSR